MADRWDDDDDWVGEPPEGRHSSDRADPGFWRRGCGSSAVVLVLIVLALR